MSVVNNGDSFRRQTGPYRWWIQHVFQPDYCTTVLAWQVGNSDEKEINIILLKVTQLLKNKKVSFGKFIVRNTSFVFRFAHLFIRKFQIDINCLKFGITHFFKNLVLFDWGENQNVFSYAMPSEEALKNFRPPSVEERKRFILCTAAYNPWAYKSS